jgi:hypothetical protein
LSDPTDPTDRITDPAPAAPAPQPPTFRTRILAFALDALENHVHEQPIGSNRGPQVDQYNEEAGVPLGSPWCLTFAYFCVHHASLHAGIPCPIPRGGLCSALYDWARAHGKLTATPQPGDIGLVRGGPRGHEHAVIVVSGDGPGLFREIAGNTSGSLAGVSVYEGYCVAEHTRPISECDFVSVG